MDVIYYESETGSCPMRDFQNGLEPNMKAAVLRDVHLLEIKGHIISMPFSRAMGDGLFELRTKASGNSVRTFYFFYVKDTIIVTHGFIKKTQQTPPAEIAKARRYKADYERRHGQ